MDVVVSAERVGAFVVFVDENGLRHAVKLNSVLSLSDADDRQDSTIMQMPMGRVVLIQAPLDVVLAWFHVG